MEIVSIVGNGPLSQEQKKRIEKSDRIYRFNSPPPDHIDNYSRTNTLVLSNSSKQTRLLLESNDYLEGPVFKLAESVLLPYHPKIISEYMPKPNFVSRLKGMKADWTELCIIKACNLDKQYKVIDEQTYHLACRKIGIAEHEARKKFPSSGIMTIISCIHQYKNSAKVEIYGFGFKGWKRHDWNGERRYIQELAANEALTMIS
jgi:hypothetical protein